MRMEVSDFCVYKPLEIVRVVPLGLHSDQVLLLMEWHFFVPADVGLFSNWVVKKMTNERSEAAFDPLHVSYEGSCK